MESANVGKFECGTFGNQPMRTPALFNTLAYSIQHVSQGGIGGYIGAECMEERSGERGQMARAKDVLCMKDLARGKRTFQLTGRIWLKHANRRFSIVRQTDGTDHSQSLHPRFTLTKHMSSLLTSSHFTSSSARLIY